MALKLVTAYDDPALDGVYKLSSINGNPTLKISENEDKITLPGTKKITRFFNQDGSFYSDGIALANEETPDVIYHPYISHRSANVGHLKSEELQHKVVDNGKVVIDKPNITESANYAKSRLNKLNDEHKRFDNPHVYKVGLSKQLRELKIELLKRA
ncbi:MAG: hypothetical protein U5K71_05820 [Gracilimonas sp.]|nr:hypothetical protein [Gracilimonas sp.]